MNFTWKWIPHSHIKMFLHQQIVRRQPSWLRRPVSRNNCNFHFFSFLIFILENNEIQEVIDFVTNVLFLYFTIRIHTYSVWSFPQRETWVRSPSLPCTSTLLPRRSSWSAIYLAESKNWFVSLSQSITFIVRSWTMILSGLQVDITTMLSMSLSRPHALNCGGAVCKFTRVSLLKMSSYQ